jgi:hypothetical protein
LTSNSIQLIAEEDLQREKERSRACEKKLKIARGEEEALASCDLSELLDWHIELEITLQKLSTAIIKKAVASQLAGNSTSPTFSPTASPLTLVHMSVFSPFPAVDLGLKSLYLYGRVGQKLLAKKSLLTS